MLFFLSSSPGTWDKSCSVPPSIRQTTWPLLNSVTWTQPQPSAVTTSLSVEGEETQFKSTCTWKQRALWSNSKGHNLLGFFLRKKKNTLGTVVISHMVLEMVGLCNIWSVFRGSVSSRRRGQGRTKLAHWLPVVTYFPYRAWLFHSISWSYPCRCGPPRAFGRHRDN